MSSYFLPMKFSTSWQTLLNLHIIRRSFLDVLWDLCTQNDSNLILQDFCKKTNLIIMSGTIVSKFYTFLPFFELWVSYFWSMRGFILLRIHTLVINVKRHILEMVISRQNLYSYKNDIMLLTKIVSMSSFWLKVGGVCIGHHN